jgi:cardiolipin synthase
VVRAQGPAVLELQAVFVSDWYLETEEMLCDALSGGSPGEGVPAQVLPSGPDHLGGGIERAVVALVHGARERIAITTPYFIPDEALLEALQTAVLRGVEVHLVVSSIPDHRVVNLAQRSYYDELLGAGVKVHLFKDKLLHAKHVSIDRSIALIGSSNIDIRSFLLNQEVSLFVYDREFVEALRAVEEGYLGMSQTLTRRDWKARPAVMKLCENIARLLSPLL